MPRLVPMEVIDVQNTQAHLRVPRCCNNIASQMLAQGDANKLTTAQLAERCADRKANKSHVPYCLELFLRALSDDHETANDAWHHIIEYYKAYVVVCIRSVIFGLSEGELDELTGDTFSRFWQYLGRRHLEGPDGLDYAVRLLAICARTVGVNRLRDLERQPNADDELSESLPVEDDEQPAAAIAQKLSDEAMWRLIRRVLGSERACIVIELSYVYELRPAQIYAARPDLFRDARHVAEVKRMALEKLFRNPDLRAEWEGK